MPDNDRTFSAEELVEAVTQAWKICQDEEELFSHLMTMGLTREEAAHTNDMVASGYTRAMIMDLGAMSSSNFDQDPIFQAALRKARALQKAAPFGMNSSPKKSIKDLTIELRDPDPNLRQMAAFELGQSGDTAAMPSLLVALEDTDPYVRISAIQSLARFSSKEAVSALVALSKSESEALVLGNVIQSLARICATRLGDRSAIPALIDATRHPNAFVRYDAALALGEIGDEQALPALEALSHDMTRPEERNEYGLLVKSSIYTVGEQARNAILKIRRRTRKIAQEAVTEEYVEPGQRKWWQRWR